MLTGFWDDNHCQRRLSYFCKRLNDTTAITDPPPTRATGFCPERWHAMGNKCIRVFGHETDAVSWNDARDQCFKIGSLTNRRTYLVSISNKWEQSAFTAIIKSASVRLWIGMRYLSGFGYAWMDNTKVTFTNWDNGIYNVRERL